jgi:ubiquitin-like 1-activating enzyme E1 A
MTKTREQVDDELALYDRQIRLWGSEAQARMQNSLVLVCGFGCVHAEVVKNIVLAGISIVVQDVELCTAEDLGGNFFLSPEDIGTPRGPAALHRVREMNPHISVEVDNRAMSELSQEYLSRFGVVLVSDASDKDALRLNDICRASSPQIPLFFSGAFCSEAWFVSDLGDKFEYKADPVQNMGDTKRSENERTQQLKRKQEEIKAKSFPPLDCVLKANLNSTSGRFFPLSKTFVVSRLLSEFTLQHGRYPLHNDFGEMSSFTSKFLASNNIDSEFLGPDDILSVCTSSRTPLGIVGTVVGGFLAQEIIKAVSRVGDPLLNVFVFSADSNIAKAFPVVPKNS